ncbi:MAG: hypothetical protein ACTSQY_11095 [Candidatus Odinarchaeia archaeon]
MTNLKQIQRKELEKFRKMNNDIPTHLRLTTSPFIGIDHVFNTIYNPLRLTKYRKGAWWETVDERIYITPCMALGRQLVLKIIDELLDNGR